MTGQKIGKNSKSIWTNLNICTYYAPHQKDGGQQNEQHKLLAKEAKVFEV